jgi:hypothetical protein
MNGTSFPGILKLTAGRLFTFIPDLKSYTALQ